MMKYKVIYMGTPHFAKEILEELLSIEALDIVCVVTQSDKKVGRKQILQYSAVKTSALYHELALLQPLKIMEAYEDLKQFKADVIITCAYGQFLPTKILNLTKHGVINIHASLLPKYRGGAPMQHAIMNGEKTTGISLMKSVLEMDAGPVYDTISVPINTEDTLETLEPRLIEASKTIVHYSLLNILDGKIEAKPQDDTLATFAKTIQKQDEIIDFSKEGITIYNQIRALNPNPYAYALLDDKRVKFGETIFKYVMHKEEYGKILEMNNKALVIAVKNGCLFIRELQVEGKQMMKTNQLVNGYKKLWEGKRFNDENN